MEELKQSIPIFSNPANQMSGNENDSEASIFRYPRRALQAKEFIQMEELKQSIPIFSNPANQMSSK